jgi:hypothetical protein
LLVEECLRGVDLISSSIVKGATCDVVIFLLKLADLVLMWHERFVEIGVLRARTLGDLHNDIVDALVHEDRRDDDVCELFGHCWCGGSRHSDKLGVCLRA